ncbi:hypothetical protein OAG68_02525 [bacterium]|nr:hypothetical protein [bacterium]
MVSHQFGDGVLRALNALSDKFTMYSGTAVILMTRQRVNAFDLRDDQLLLLLSG